MQLLVFWAILTGILVLMVLLYQLPEEAVVLSVCLSLPVLMGFLGYRWHQYRKVTRLIMLQDFNPERYPKDVEPYVECARHLLEEKRMVQEQAIAEQKELMDYFSLWAHQTKLPLAVLRLLCEQDPLDIKAIRLQIRRLGQYIDMAMAYIRLEADSDYQLENQAVDPIIKRAIRSFSTEFIHKKIHLEYRETGRMVITDSKWLGFVIEQILSNAIRYTPEGGTIKIYASGSLICIQDTGCGIDPADLPRIFDQGFSGFNGHAASGSSGIGLYLCRKVLDRLSHTIEIESIPQIGTNVMIDLQQEPLLIK